MTKPLRSASKGMEARRGSALSLRAFMAVKPPMARGVMAASVPPHSITSPYPSRMWRKASPTALVPPAQAVTTQVHIP